MENLNDLLVLDFAPNSLSEDTFLKLLYDVEWFKIQESQVRSCIAVKRSLFTESLEGTKLPEDCGFYSPRVTEIPQNYKRWTETEFLP